MQPFEKMPWGYTVCLHPCTCASSHPTLFNRAFSSSRTVEVSSVRLSSPLSLPYPNGSISNNHSTDTAEKFKSRAAKAIWDFEGVYASSRHIPGVRFAGVSHPGLIGTAPSKEMLEKWNTREKGLIDECGECTPPVAYPPLAKGAYVGPKPAEEVMERIRAQGARTVPGREHGGNCDVSPRMMIEIMIFIDADGSWGIDQEPVEVRIVLWGTGGLLTSTIPW